MELSEKELLEIRRLFANHFANKASDEMDKLWSSNQWSDDTMEEWLKLAK